jgi:dTDP-glucose 4,6-dehydratase/UDP-glucose 4-epimerase
MGWEHVVPQFVLRARDMVRANPRGPVPFPIQGTGFQTRAFIHIDDFTDGLMTVIAKGGHREIYNIGTTEEIAIGELARKVVAYFGREARLIPSPAPEGGTPRRCPDISKLQALGFAPHISLDDALPPLIDWYVAHAHRAPAKHNALA